MTVVKEMIKSEGMTAFFKGLTPKVRIGVPPLSRIAEQEVWAAW